MSSSQLPAAHAAWLVLVTQLPDDAAVRMRILRMLDAMGCGILRDGVFVLPASPEAEQGLDRLGVNISASGGSHHLLRVQSDDAQTQTFSRLFDRGARYAELIKTIDSMRTAFGIADPTALSRMLMKQKRELEAITSLDFFPSESRDRAAHALAAAEAEIRKILFPQSKNLGDSQQLRTQQKFFHRVWVTQKPFWADRLASAWLIRRFIDAEGKVVGIDRGARTHESAVTFGFEGALFCNTSSMVTYEVLLESFNLTRDAALKRIAGIVHVLDIGGTPVPEAAGVEAMLQGAQRRALSEDALIAETEKTFDLLYDAYYQAPGEVSGAAKGPLK